MRNYKITLELKNKWIEALRSGNFKQTHRAKMRTDDDCFCANGVAAMAIGLDLRKDDCIYVNGINRRWKPFVEIIPKDLFEDICTLNDIKKLTFIEISDWLEINAETI